MRAKPAVVRASSQSLQSYILDAYNLQMRAKHAADAAKVAKDALKKKIALLDVDPETGNRSATAYRVDKNSNKIPVVATLRVDNETIINDKLVKKTLTGEEYDNVVKIQLGLLKDQVSGAQLKKFTKSVPKKNPTFVIK